MFRADQTGKIWINDGTKEKMVHKDEVSKYLKMGFERGRNHNSVPWSNKNKSDLSTPKKSKPKKQSNEYFVL